MSGSLQRTIKEGEKDTGYNEIFPAMDHLLHFTISPNNRKW